MNKTLIELMLEANVEWPEGAEFAAQDKDESQLCFYKELPKRDAGSYWWLGKPMKTERLPELCRNWRQTIVTREQYEQAMASRSGNNSCDIDVKIGSIIDQISHHQAESQRHEEAMIDHNDKELALRDQLNEMLAKVGMNVVDVEREVVEESGGTCGREILSSVLENLGQTN